MSVKTPSQIKWETLVSHLTKWFHKPDLEALEIVLSAAASHPVIKGDPIWLFVQGPSGSGKGEVIIQALRDLPPKVKVLGSINRNSLISFNRGQPGGELLQLPDDVNNHKTGIFAFKDFTTMLSLREEERNEVISQLREVYDGQWTRSTGSGFYTWVGRVTCIAACTPALESAWAVKRDLGERFLTVRWHRTGSIDLAKKAGKQRGFESQIRENTSRLAKEFVTSVSISSLPDIPEAIFEKIGNLAELVAVLRANVPRSGLGKREVIGEPVPEEPGRIHKSLAAIASSHSALFQKREVDEDDFRMSRRVALDSIPSYRFALFRHFPQTEEWVNAQTLAKKAHVAVSTVVWNADEMVALGTLEVNEEKEVKEYRLTPLFQKLTKGAGLTLPF